MGMKRSAKEKVMEKVTERGVRTRDLGGKAGTKEVTEAVCRELEGVYGGKKV